jgi:pyridoxal phosphate enzyme (YggS family)
VTTEHKIGEHEIAGRLNEILARIAEACARQPPQGQPVRLVAVSKRQPIERVRALYSALPLIPNSPPLILGENYVQEWAEKREELPPPSEVHLIGPLQSNKAREAVRLFDVIESVHSSKLVTLISKEAQRANKVQRIFLQVNISGDSAKSGFSPDEIPKALEQVRALPALSLEGLMTITREYATPEEARGDFRAMRSLRDRLNPALGLSMGMSSDFDIAIQEGATHVRVGSALFGSRA